MDFSFDGRKTGFGFAQHGHNPSVVERRREGGVSSNIQPKTNRRPAY
jgi:hypothetical protein